MVHILGKQEKEEKTSFEERTKKSLGSGLWALGSGLWAYSTRSFLNLQG
jgi:hypothetical protein